MPVYQEKNKSKQTKDGRSWYYRTYYEDMYGNRKQKVSKLYFTKKEAKDAEAEFLIKAEHKDETDNNISFECVFNEWLLYKKSQVKSTTYYGIKRNTSKHILSYFKDFKLHAIKTNSLTLWKEELEKNKFTINYQNAMINYFTEILEYAKNNYNFNSKIISKLHKDKIETVRDIKETVEQNYWTYEEFNIFIKVVDNELYKTMFTFLYYTGLRLGEMIALTWNDIDFANKTLRVNKTYADKIEGSNYIITSPKTTNSIRMIELDNNLCEILKKHFEQEKQIYNFNNNIFIFGNFKHISPTTFRNHLNKYIEVANVKKISPHGFRHSHVSLLINLGCDSRDVADRVGDTIEVVKTTYYHMFPSKKSKTVMLLNKINIKNEM